MEPIVRSLIFSALLSSLLFACDTPSSATAEDDELADEIPADGKLDTLSRPTDHGFLPYATPAEASFAAEQRVHAYEFRVDAKATVTASVEATADAVLYLYRETATGSWRKVDRVMTSDETTWAEQPEFIAELETTLAPGVYRVIAKAASTRSYGAVASTELTCRGAGCPARQCLFEAAILPFSWTELSLLEIDATETFASDDTIPAATRRQFLAASGEATLADAWDTTNEGMFTRTELTDSRTGDRYAWVVYGDLDDDVRGAFFTLSGSTALARHDTDEFSTCTRSW